MSKFNQKSIEDVLRKGGLTRDQARKLSSAILDEIESVALAGGCLSLRSVCVVDFSGKAPEVRPGKFLQSQAKISSDMVKLLSSHV